MDTKGGPFVNSLEALVVAKGEYYGGGPITNARVNWACRALKTKFQPPNWNAWKFGMTKSARQESLRFVEPSSSARSFALTDSQLAERLFRLLQDIFIARRIKAKT